MRIIIDNSVIYNSVKFYFINDTFLKLVYFDEDIVYINLNSFNSFAVKKGVLIYENL